MTDMDKETLEIPLPRTVTEQLLPNEEGIEASEATSEEEPAPLGEAEPQPPEPSPENTSEPSGYDNEAMKALSSDVTKLIERMAGLEKLFETRILHTEYEEKMVDKMHNELQRYREDIYSQLVRPILMDIIEIRDSILRITVAYQSKPEGEQNIPLKTFEMYAFDVQEILEKNNIEIYRSEINTDYVPVRQRVAKKTPTGDESHHGKVAESLSDGYEYLGKTIAPEKVAVYLYEPQQINEDTEAIKAVMEATVTETSTDKEEN
jgi:molecular chaperone GrpE (heat shock protein)